MPSKSHIDWFILLPVVALMLFSIAFVYSASATIAEVKFGSAEELFLKHALRIGLGLLVIIAFSKIDYHHYRKLSKPFLILAVILLVVVLFMDPLNKVSRWINIGPVSFQPSELAKFAMVFHFATLMDKKKDQIRELKEGYMPFIIWTGIICLLIALQPNFSTTIVIYLIAVSMLFIGNAKFTHLLSTVVVSALAGLAYLGLKGSYRLERLMAYFGDGSAYMEDNINYQLNQALLAMGSGGFFGVGPGHSRQSHFYLPESYGDFIFSIVGEEYGFIGVTIILALFLFIFWRGMIAAKRAPDEYGYFLGAGIVITFAYYVFVNAGVNSGLLPTTGLPMPFISYGGTAVLFYSAAIGVLLNISSQKEGA